MLKNIYNLTLALAIILTAGPSVADTCKSQNMRCLETGNVVVAGVAIENVCIRAERTEECARSAPLDECSSLASHAVSATPLNDGQCFLESENCLRSIAGVCDKHKRVYRCWNGPRNDSQANLDDRKFLNFSEEITNNCGSFENDVNCSLNQTTITQGFATRNINEQEVTRAWWEQERQYDCTNNLFENDCQPYDDAPFCTPTGVENCLNYASDGSCEYTEREYNCESDTSFTASCEAINTCVGENCLNIEPEISDDYPVAAAWLTFLDDAAKSNQCDGGSGDTGDQPVVTDVLIVSGGVVAPRRIERTTVYPDGTRTVQIIENGVVISETTTPPPDGDDPVTAADCDTGFLEGGASEPEVFGGDSMSCFMDAFANCCRNPGKSYCGAEPLDLKYRIDAGAAHQLGTRCTSRFFGICLSWSREYCTYKSKFARVFQEQVDIQTGIQFRWREHEECPPMTIEQLESIDPSTLDMSEMFGDMLDQANEPVENLVIELLEKEMGLHNGDVQDTFQ